MIQLSRRTVALLAIAIAASLAIAVTSLVRTADAGAGFSDTPPWIAAHAAWLQDNGIADGFPDGTFKPNDNITRGQAAYWFGNYNNAITKHVQAFTEDPSPVTAAGAFVACPAGKRPIGGGGNINDPLMHMTESEPTDPSYPLGEGWLVGWNAPAGGIGDQPGEVFVFCAPTTITTP